MFSLTKMENKKTIKKKLYEAVNWDTPENDYASMFWEQNLKQFWIDTEYIPSNDISSYNSLTDEDRDVFNKALAGLTLLDTLQTVSIVKMMDHVSSLQNRSVIAFMGMMESIHAKSYSTIFTTVITKKKDINELFDWVLENKHLQYKAKKIDSYYVKLNNMDATKEEVYMGMVASIFLETFLFYSGFFYPLWLAGQGEMIASSDIIKKIVADESIHGVFIGILAQEIYNKFPKEKQEKIYDKLMKLLDDLMENELKYTEEIYTKVNLTNEVKEYLKYNANKALMNLGFKEKYKKVKVNPIVLGGINLETTQHDFFSKKSTNYEKPTKVEKLTDEDFDDIFN